MQVTGNKKIFTEKILSIAISAGGHSFWTEELCSERSSPEKQFYVPLSRKTRKALPLFPAAKDSVIDAKVSEKIERFGKYSSADRVFVVLDSHKTVMIPEALFEEEQAEKYLSIHNYRQEAGETRFVGGSVSGCSSVTLFDRNALDGIRSIFGDKCTVMSGLQYGRINRPADIPDGGKYTSVLLMPSNLYVTVSRSAAEPVYTDVLPVRSCADILYFLQRLDSLCSGLGVICIKGVNCGEIFKVLKKYFKNCRCV